MINENDAKTLGITPNKSKKELHNYKATFHLTDGKTITSTCEDQPYDKLTFADRLCMCNFALLEEGSMCVNLRNVTYIEVKEIKND